MDAAGNAVSGVEMDALRAVCALQPRHPDPAAAVYPPLPVRDAPPGSGRLRICIVTQDIVGPVRNGGIGTAYRYAAELLAQAGHDVTILYALGQRSENGPISRWVAEYRRLGVTFVPLPEPAVRNYQGYIGEQVARAYAVYEWLKQRQFDLVHASEWRGLAYYCLVAKHLGIAFPRTLFAIKTSSPTLWNMEGNAELVDDARVLIVSHLERKSVELADVVISGSTYMLRWMLAHGYNLPARRCFVQPNIVPVIAAAPADGGPVDIDELVFFGRLEPRKGLHLFCDALRRMNLHGLKPFRVTFLGKVGARFNGREFIEQSAAHWKFPWQILDTLGQPEALRYLGEGRRLAVMPSLLDNSPFGVYECLSAGIPFITSDVGGGPELIHPDDRTQALFSLQPADLAQHLRHALLHGAPRVRAAYDFAHNNEHWRRWHQQLADGGLEAALRRSCQSQSSGPGTASGPLVSVCIPHHDRPRYLTQALHSLEQQIFRDFEVIVVDDGSRTAEAKQYLDGLAADFAARGWTLVRQPNRYAAAARNEAARRARGRYLYFLDDDNVAKPDALATLVEIAERTGADVLTCFADQFSGEELPGPDTKPEARLALLGDAAALGAIANGFGDMHSLVRRDAFVTLGGFREEYGVGKEDMEFFARAVLRGFTLHHVPEALYWYRKSAQRIRHRHYHQHAGEYRVLQAYLDVTPHAIHPLLLLAQGLVHAQSLAGELSRILPDHFPGASVELQSGREMAEDLAARPRLYRLAHRLLRVEIALWTRFLRWQIRFGGAALRAVMRWLPR
jgi:glycosyltransferase involved in cell wall biosynthesis